MFQPAFRPTTLIRRLRRHLLALFRQSLVDARPALGAFGVKALDGWIDFGTRGVGQAAEFVGRHDDGDVAAEALDADGLGLRHVDKLAEMVFGDGCGEGFHGGEIS